MVTRELKTVVTLLLVCCCSTSPAQTKWRWGDAQPTRTPTSRVQPTTDASFDWSAVPAKSPPGLIGPSGSGTKPIARDFFNKNTSAQRSPNGPSEQPALAWPARPGGRQTALVSGLRMLDWESLPTGTAANTKPQQTGYTGKGATSRPNWTIPWAQSESVANRTSPPVQERPKRYAPRPDDSVSASRARFEPPAQPSREVPNLAARTGQPADGFSPGTLVSSRSRFNVPNSIENEPLASPVSQTPASRPIDHQRIDQHASQAHDDQSETLAIPQFALVPMQARVSPERQQRASQEANTHSNHQPVTLQEFPVAVSDSRGRALEGPVEIMPFPRLVTAGTAIKQEGSLTTAAMTGPLGDASTLFRRLNLDNDFRQQPAELPADVRGTRDDYGNPMQWTHREYVWATPTFAHRPLYFEQPNLERYGNGPRRAYQPALSGAHFFSSVAALPYKMIASPPKQPVYTLGHRRPGDYVPRQGRVLLGQ